MRCENCGNNIRVAIGSDLRCEGAKILSSITSVFTVKCNECQHEFQISVESKVKD